MDVQLRGRRALVCGATQGIGRAVAHELAALGARIIMLARDGARLEELRRALASVPEGGHDHIAVDMSDTAALKKALEQLGETPVDIVVNNSGGPPPGNAHEADPEAFASAFRQHLLAYQAIVLHCVPGMKARRHGRIINIISTSVKQPLPDLGVSNTIRGAVANWAKTLANELGPFGITVNNVLPGATDTERLAAIIARKAAQRGVDEAEAARELMTEVPLRRFARPEEIAYAVAFLAGPAGAYINGINLPVDGGRTACL
jgi:3-oxoacyl-[acyl-carrier protein] reductase